MSIRPALCICVAALFAFSVETAYGEEAVPTREVRLGGVVLSIPQDWKQQQPSSQMRLAEFAVAALAGDGESMELTVFRFGPGNVKANVDRWRGQFESAGRKFKAVSGKSRVGEYVFVEGSGIYKKSVGPPILRKTESVPGSRMLAAILADGQSGNLYLKLVGPDKSVTAQLKAFRASFAATADSEKPYKE